MQGFQNIVDWLNYAVWSFGIPAGDQTIPWIVLLSVQSAAPLTMNAFRSGLTRFGDWGHYVVLVSVLLFGISTAIAWSYYGERSAFYLLGERVVVPYRIVYVIMHFTGAVLPLAVAWNLGLVFLGLVMVPNLIALILLTPRIRELTDSYFERQPWRKAS